MASLSLSQRVKSPSDQATQVFNLLNAYCQPASAVTPASVAEEINWLAQGVLNDAETDLESFLWELWKEFITIAKQVPNDHPAQDRLVAVIRALAELSPTTIQIWGSDTCLWKDLPLLAPSMREAWISPTLESAAPAEQDMQEWVNLHSFAARLLTLEYISWVQFPLWALRSALEEQSSGAKLDCDASAAAEWILHSADQIYEGIATHTGENMAPGVLYQGPPGVCPERWRFWKTRFGEIAAHGGVAGEKALAARNRMDAVDTVEQS